MKIALQEDAARGPFAAVTAEITWEQRQRPPQRVYVAVPEEHRGLLAGAAEGFLTAALPSAARHREARVVLDVPVDPTLTAGLEVARTYYGLWQALPHVAVEAPVASTAPSRAEGAALFLSGGVDSMSSLWANLQHYPQGHPHRITHGLHLTLNGPDLDELATAELTLPPGLGDTVASHGVTLVPVVTNLRALEDYEFGADWMWHAHGAVLAGVAHCFGQAFSTVYLASSYDAGHLVPWGSHPLVDQHYSSSAVTIVHDGEQHTRLDKLRLLTDWPAALTTLDVCFLWRHRVPGQAPNCGACEKCQRTLAALIALGVPTEGLTAFRNREVSPRSLRRVVALKDEYERNCWRENLRALESTGRPEARAVRSLLRRDAAIRVVNRGPGKDVLRAAKRRLRPTPAPAGNVMAAEPAS